MEYYQQSPESVFARLRTQARGLSPEEAGRRLVEHGANAIAVEAGINPLLLFLGQFKNFIIYVLLFAVAFALLIGEYLDSLIILAILLANACIGFFQELSAHRSLEALKKLSAIRATVIRDGRRAIIDARELVPGDLIQVEAGDKVPADARLVEAVRLKVEEAALTGESVPAEKNAAAINSEVQLGDRRNMLFSSTSVVTGNGTAVVVATGMATEIGKISRLVSEAEEGMTPLQKRLHLFGKKLGAVIIAICVLIFFLFALREYLDNGGISRELFIAFIFIAISLAVAAVPTALPAVVNIALSIGVKRLLAKKALVRRLSSVETLGSCDVICTDKTGTLTENQMTVRHAWTLAGEAALSGSGYSPAGELSRPLAPLLFTVGIICNNASLVEKDGLWQVIGDPTEGALLAAAAKAGVAARSDRLDEIPFDSTRKMMSVLGRSEGEMTMYCKGAPGHLLACCGMAQVNGEVVPLTDDLRRFIEEQNDVYAGRALRVLGFAYKPVAGREEFREEDLIFVGLQAMIDPPRLDVLESLKRTKEAGIRVIMITGDYQATAKAIGAELGIEGALRDGATLDGMSEDELIAALRDNTNIFARVIPEHKQRIVTALQRMGHTVAMTGDGVNDAPALKKADIGVAVGSGTEVAKEAADFVLLDDSFSHIVNAIEEGRGIYDNIQKSIMLLLSGNLGEVLIIFLAAILDMNLPLTAILLLWINMVTDGAPALAYTVDPYGRDIMRRRPKPRDENILPGPKLALIAVLGTVGAFFALGLFAMFGGRVDDAEELMRGQTMVFNFVVLYEVILIFVIRKSYQVPFFSNKWVWAAALFSGLLQAVLMYTPLRFVFRISALTMPEITALGAAGLFFYMASILYHSLADLKRNERGRRA
ncbi:cation-translocating P-type ATPase [Thiovibrio sp. JS02]